MSGFSLLGKCRRCYRPIEKGLFCEHCLQVKRDSIAAARGTPNLYAGALQNAANDEADLEAHERALGND